MVSTQCGDLAVRHRRWLSPRSFHSNIPSNLQFSLSIVMIIFSRSVIGYHIAESRTLIIPFLFIAFTRPCILPVHKHSDSAYRLNEMYNLLRFPLYKLMLL
ncbi:hypothetical protein PM082_002231 [Marasmius tenuissimus]|nr:hypothetical protein PM082_002231 [Marasmius tenuissimus]